MAALVVSAVFIVNVELKELPGVNNTNAGAKVELTPEITDALNVTFPVKPRLLIEIFAVADFPASKLEGEGRLAVTV